MTRINTIDPVHLTNEWLIAEFRELPRIVNELHKHPQRFKLKDIPKEFTLNTGHVKFFRNKLLYLSKRHTDIIKELSERGINFDKKIKVDLDNLSPSIKLFGCNDWKPSKRDHKLIVERLTERFNLRKKAYHLTTSSTKVTINCDESYNNYKSACLDNYIK